MRISIPIDVWDPERGGTERYLDRLTRSLVERGHTVTVLCLEARGMASAAPPEGLEVETLDLPRFPRWRREFRFAREAVQAHRRSKRDLLLAVRHALFADVYHPHGGSFVAGRRAASGVLTPWARCGRRALGVVRPSLRVLSWLDRQVFECSPHLLTVVVSRKVEEDFQKTYPKVRFQFRRLYNAVDLEDFHDRDREQRRSEIADRLQLPAGIRLALFVGHNFRLKGLRHAVSAVARTTNWHLLVAGGGADAVYRRQARLAGVERRVHFVGPQKRLRELYAASDAALLPTYYDTCSLATLESAACGLPVVTTRLNGASELIMPSDAGIVVDHPRQEDLLAHALTEVDLHWLRYHENALALRPDLCWKRHMDRFEEILAESHAVR